MESFALNFASTSFVLLAVCALAWFAIKRMRDRSLARDGVNRADEALRFVRAVSVGPKERVVIVEHRGARWMLGVTAGGISTIAQWPAAEEGAKAASDS